MASSVTSENDDFLKRRREAGANYMGLPIGHMFEGGIVYPSTVPQFKGEVTAFEPTRFMDAAIAYLWPEKQS